MKKITVLLLLVFCVMTVAQEDSGSEIIKDGWNVGLLPAITFNTDLGFQYGVVVNLFNYGDGSRYPDYDHNIYIEASRYTKGSGIYRFYYDSNYLIPGLQTTFDLSYLPDDGNNFFGFNGYESVYNVDWTDDESDDYRSRMFYKMQRNLFRIKADFQGKLKGKKWKWIAGVTGRNFDIGSVDVDKLNKGQDEEDKLPSVETMPGLYDRYVDWGLIPEEHKNGGYLTVFKAGLVYDTRPYRQNPPSGTWTEVVLLASPSALGDADTFLKLSATHRQYFTLFPEKLIFAYRLAYQGTLSGDVPFYFHPIVETSVLTGATNEGLGGARTLRGAMLNRIVGNGIGYANLELRYKAIDFTIGSQNFYIGLVGFFDMGQVVQPVDFDIDAISNNVADSQDYFDDGAESLHYTAGVGLKIAMNRNFVVSVENGYAFNKQDGKSGLYIGLNYLW